MAGRNGTSTRERAKANFKRRKENVSTAFRGLLIWFLVKASVERRRRKTAGRRRTAYGIWQGLVTCYPALLHFWLWLSVTGSRWRDNFTQKAHTHLDTHTHTHTERQPPALRVTTYINKQWRTDMRIGGSSRSSSCERQAQPDTSLSLSNQGHFICTHSHRSVKREAHSARAVKVVGRKRL